MALPVCCSAPGKVLVTGGYLILERPNPGLVFTVNARFYSIIHPYHGDGKEEEDRGPSKDHPSARIRVISPQFNSTLEYLFQWSPVVSLEKM